MKKKRHLEPVPEAPKDKIVKRAADLTTQHTRPGEMRLLSTDPKRSDPNAHMAAMPMDVPVSMCINRLIKQSKADELYHKGEGRYSPPLSALHGWTIELDAYTYGVKMVVKMTRDGKIQIWAKDEDGSEKLGEWEK